MTDSTGAVYDLGYAPYDGERLGRKGARRTIFWDGVRRVLGLRRKARRKVLPWLLVTIAALPPIAYVGISFLIPFDQSELASAAQQHSQFMALGGTIVMLFAALAAPELLIPDRKDGVLEMLASRPITPTDYIVTRFMSLVAVVGAFLLAPQFVLYIGIAATDSSGFVGGLVGNADNIPRILSAAAVYVIAYVPLSFVVSSIAKRKAIASAVYLASMIALTGFAEAIVREASVAGGRWVALLAPINTADAASAWIFGQESPESLLAVAEFHPSAGLVALLVVGSAATTYSLLRYGRLM